MRWYVTTNGETVGPVEGEVVAAWAREGRLLPGTHVRDESASTWIPVELSPFASRPLPMPIQIMPAAAPNGWTCRHCGAQGSGKHSSSITTGGWIVFVLLLPTCILWVLPLLLMRERKTQCLRCGTMV